MIPILMYHRVNDTAPGQDLYPGMSLSPVRFEAQMRYLAEGGYRSLTLSQLAQIQNGLMEKPRCAVALTFDDGYRDNHAAALPIMRKYGMTATIFLVAERIGGTNDWDLYEDGLAPRLMSLNEIHEMKMAGIEFGSHTLTHAALTRVSPEEARRQIHDSRQLLVNALDVPIGFFSYPYDLVNDAVLEMVAQSGYEGACGASSLPQGPFNRWRIECLGCDSMRLFRLKASGLYYHLMWLRDRTVLGKALLRAKKRMRLWM